jgi:uncharacterized protein (DUF1697 family)
MAGGGASQPTGLIGSSSGGPGGAPGSPATQKPDYIAAMSKHVAFLRGINLGRRRRVGSAELRSRFEEMGFRDVDTFRTSGNVIFAAEREPRAKIADRLEQGLAESLGWEVTIFLRTASETRAIADHQPFAGTSVQAPKGKLHVMLLSAKPAARTREGVLALSTDEDRLAFGDRELYWLASGGIADSGLDFKAIERLLGATTMRTKGTIDQLAAKYLDG